jgi:hypothetical protein
MTILLGCGDSLLHFLRMLLHQSTIHGTKSQVSAKAIDRSEDEDYCPTALALVQIVHEKDTLMQCMPNSTLRTACFICDRTSGSRWFSMYSNPPTYVIRDLRKFAVT